MENQEHNRILAIDYGKKRVGIAITDPLRMFAYPLTTINNDKNLLRNIIEILSNYSVEKIVLGYPLREDGSASDSTQLVEEFLQRLKKQIKLEIITYDERYSSEIAKERIINTVKSKKKRRDKNLVDKTAACIILEDYLKEFES